jgi:hypothetical protein
MLSFSFLATAKHVSEMVKPIVSLREVLWYLNYLQPHYFLVKQIYASYFSECEFVSYQLL